MVNNTSTSNSNSENTSDNIRKMVYASLFAALTAIGAYITVPLGPVPFTLQVVFVLMAGAMLGKKWGALSITVYTLIGIAGLPVFAGGSSGIGIILGPTGGYILGFIAAAFVIGALFERKNNNNIVENGIYLTIGAIVIYIFGLPHYAIVADISPSEAILTGLVPFIIPDFIKIVVATIIVTKYKQ